MKLRNKVLRVLHRRTGIGRPSYVYRNLSMSSRDPGVWFVSGYDRHNNKRGILEWCRDEADARQVLERIKQYPRQFESIEAGQFSNVDWIRTSWDNHY